MIRPLRSAPVTGASPLLRAGPPACPATVLNLSQFLLLETLPLAASRTAADAGTGTCLPTFHAKAADQARVASMPDTAWPVSGLPPSSSRGSNDAPVPMSPDCITTRPQRFTRVRLPGPHLTPQPAPFPHRSPRSRHHYRSMWRFEASLRRATPKGQTFIFRTAPRPTAAYLHDHLPSRSWHTIGLATRKRSSPVLDHQSGRRRQPRFVDIRLSVLCLRLGPRDEVNVPWDREGLLTCTCTFCSRLSCIGRDTYEPAALERA
jgi:hypothetical protein